MRSLVFTISLLSFVMYRAAKLEAPLKGTLNQSYRTEKKNADLKTVLGKVELFNAEIEKRAEQPAYMR